MSTLADQPIKVAHVSASFNVQGGLDIWLTLELPNRRLATAYIKMWRDYPRGEADEEVEITNISLSVKGPAVMPHRQRYFHSESADASSTGDNLVAALEELLRVASTDPLLSVVVASEWASLIRKWADKLAEDEVEVPTAQYIRRASTLKRQLKKSAAACEKLGA